MWWENYKKKQDSWRKTGQLKKNRTYGHPSVHRFKKKEKKGIVKKFLTIHPESKLYGIIKKISSLKNKNFINIRILVLLQYFKYFMVKFKSCNIILTKFEVFWFGLMHFTLFPMWFSSRPLNIIYFRFIRTQPLLLGVWA